MKRNSAKRNLYLGIDIGSVSLGLVLIDEERNVVRREYVFHKGNISECLNHHLRMLNFSRIRNIAYNHKSVDFFNQGSSIYEQIALLEGTRHEISHIGSLIIIGGETFGLILFNEKGQYQKYIANSSCAAGTGAFLDQQAGRLGLSSSTELSRLALSFDEDPPKIATRCAVFAKTDLIHCQQEGYSLEAISAGLCQGLAQNIGDTLIKGVQLQTPVVVVGGVSKNQKVMHYLSEIIGSPITIPKHPELTEALGCALLARAECQQSDSFQKFSLDTLLKNKEQQRQYFFPPLSSTLTEFPDFSDHDHFDFKDVEVDLYEIPDHQMELPVYLGIDIGSTSTKAIIMRSDSEKQSIVLGVYTRTMGQPINATQALFRAIFEIQKRYGLKFNFVGVGTTGSGRKFIQKVINANMAVDEITAHARAAYALNPKVDTIIEIGGQDAKFTVMKDGQVTFSVMNYVCAAGTGSFIEEQAKRLNVSLDEYSDLAVGTPSPLTSDRCTVFMERDLNHLMSQGYSKRELLAAVLHSVRDNYLSKVAHLNKIGDVICFQGATAKNKALVMAFEQKLKKPIYVSRYCHLTGALGVCLILKEENVRQSQFRGLEFFKETLTVAEEICEDCKNHCKLRKITIGDETLVWGYMCGKDLPQSERSRRRSNFDLLSSRRRIFTLKEDVEEEVQPGLFKFSLDDLKSIDFDISLDKLKEKFDLNLLTLRHSLFKINRPAVADSKERRQIKIGIPNTLYLIESLPFWKQFFSNLGYTVVVSSSKPERLKVGKEIAKAEFCAPISNWHGHVKELCERADYLFLPHVFEGGSAENPKLFCYYSNYAVAMVRNNESFNIKDRSIEPFIDFTKSEMYNIQQIYESLPDELKMVQTPSEIKEAYMDAWRWFNIQKRRLVEFFRLKYESQRSLNIVLIGRPYLILDPVMNKNIPQKFSDLGGNVFFQDMLPISTFDDNPVGKEYLEWNHWKYGNDILQAAEYIGRNDGLYPVLLTAFKCSPDSFIIGYFKEIMDTYQKPYLILQLDEHGSDVGYETRIEAAVRSFKNHYQNKKSVPVPKKIISVSRKPVTQGTILVPNYDPISCQLICAAFEHAGYKTVLIEETPTTIISSLRMNDGQCLPVSAIVQAGIETIKKYKLAPEKTSIFMNAITRTACNFPQYPLMAKKLLEQQGGGFEKVQIFATEFEMRGCPYEVVYDVYCSYFLGGLLRRMACKIRPYEVVPGQTDEEIDKAKEKLYHCIAKGQSKEPVFKEIVNDLKKIPVTNLFGTKPKVSIVGDLYVRDNDVFNQQLVHELEGYGAEVVTTPFTYILRMLAVKHTYSLKKDGKYLAMVRDKLLIDLLEAFEKRFFHIANEILGEEFPTFDESIFQSLEKYNLSYKHGGETSQNIMKIYSLLSHYPDLKLLIHVNPIFCCPGLVSESIFDKIEKDIGIPIVSVIYDGTMTKRNEILAPYLHFINKGIERQKKVSYSAG